MPTLLPRDVRSQRAQMPTTTPTQVRSSPATKMSAPSEKSSTAYHEPKASSNMPPRSSSTAVAGRGAALAHSQRKPIESSSAPPTIMASRPGSSAASAHENTFSSYSNSAPPPKARKVQPVASGPQYAYPNSTMPAAAQTMAKTNAALDCAGRTHAPSSSAAATSPTPIQSSLRRASRGGLPHRRRNAFPFSSQPRSGRSKISFSMCPSLTSG